MLENGIKLKNKIAQNVLIIIIAIIAGIALIICQIINRQYIEKFLRELLRVPSIIGGPDITTNFKVTVDEFLGYIFSFLMAFVILSLTVGFFKKKEGLKDFYNDLTKIYKTKFFFLLFLEGIVITLVLTYIVVMFPIKSDVKVNLSKLQHYIMWAKGSAYANIFWLIQMLIIAIMEESIFRGIIYKGFSKITTKLWSAMITSIIFALYHIYPFETGVLMLRNVIISLLLIYMLEKTKTIWWSVGIHFGLNALLFEEVSSKEGHIQLAFGIIIVFSAYIILDYLIQQYYNKRDQKDDILGSELKDKEKKEESAVEYLS
ncbi:CPBP family intramembrane metalloprotease [Caldicellulosiruptor changbaiensis]|uniref:CPBP family intramembrane metalloprotease n=1 Tax=Caldicellulosiruptor changbaiensis TaxID=1222016 RepID=A0A3T0D8P7_9FIRM|nr:type II CAAX endopeptidase family protein [Caldicellulosiruptor changbaiensis]AZT91525.1 CPBP family intramembrane metalloprotease [Caldicellulosiruptor changbaiensis]